MIWKGSVGEVTWKKMTVSTAYPWDPGLPSENGFMEPKNYAFRFGDEGHFLPSFSDNMTVDSQG